MIDLQQRRDAIRSELEALRVQRGASMLDGEVFDAQRILALEAEEEALSDATGEATRRARQLQAEEERERDARLQAREEAAWARRLARVEKAQGLLKSYAREVSAMFADGDEWRQIRSDRKLSIPIPMMKAEEASRFAAGLCWELRGITHAHRFGPVQLLFGPMPKDRSWAETESALVKKGKSNGSSDED